MRTEGLSFGKKKNKNVETFKNRTEIAEEEEIHTNFKIAKDDSEISKINRKMLDLNLHDSEDRTAAKQEYKFKLPHGAEKIDRVGYEEVFIPESEKNVNETLIEV